MNAKNVQSFIYGKFYVAVFIQIFKVSKFFIFSLDYFQNIITSIIVTFSRKSHKTFEAFK
jgi:hypothetical protein